MQWHAAPAVSQMRGCRARAGQKLCALPVPLRHDQCLLAQKVNCWALLCSCVTWWWCTLKTSIPLLFLLIALGGKEVLSTATLQLPEAHLDVMHSATTCSAMQRTCRAALYSAVSPSASCSDASAPCFSLHS